MSDLFSPPPAEPPARDSDLDGMLPAPTSEVEKINIDLPPCPPQQVGRPVTLHDGRQVDSCSDDWRRECLARYMLRQLDPQERDQWLSSLRGDAYFETEMRMLIGSLQAANRNARMGKKGSP